MRLKQIIAAMVIGFGINTYATTDNLINALIKVESSGRAKVVGDNGKANGQLQVWKAVVKDVNTIYNTKYSHTDMFDKDKSKDVCKKYLIHYGKQYEKDTGKKPDEKVYARIWNGGPRGYIKKSTVKYWEKVSKYL